MFNYHHWRAVETGMGTRELCRGKEMKTIEEEKFKMAHMAPDTHTQECTKTVLLMIHLLKAASSKIDQLDALAFLCLHYIPL